MQYKKRIRLGILGAGTVGQSLIKIIEKEQNRILRNHGISIEISKVGDRSFEKKEILKKYNCTKNLNEVIEDKEIDIIVELIGGIEPARELIIKAIENHKSIVTANKALLANHGKTIFELIKQKQQNNIPITIGFEASVGGALPIIKNLRRMWSFGNIHSLVGILNGTCNFIISKMEEGLEYQEALKLAQEKGFAEADPTFDVSGKDAGQKLAIISSLASGCWIEEKDIIIEGIEKIQKIDHEIAQKWGMVIRLIAISRFYHDQLLLRVHPALISKNHLLADVRNEYNALFVEEEYSGSTFIVGKGAGGFPTASAVLADIVSIASGSKNLWFQEFGSTKLIQDADYRFYLRFQTIDKPGVLAAISRVLADFNISIASMHQEEGEEPVNVVIFTHECKESAISRALEVINQKKEIILAPTIVLRVFH
ncbi:MAG: homoserine dehydrogenase [Leptospiraceae bacterium]|nr:homoserine dehydrogenase [Leptospiraceae bacterium]